jgi:acid phosphatase family membrane protein YuiD
LNLLTNQLVLSALLAMVLAQVSKVLLILLTERRWVPGRVTETGGMPSSHSATVSALCTSCGLKYGVDSPFFAITLVFGIIVVYDATGVRRAAGRHAEILNELIENFSHLFEEENRPRALKTLLGHTYPQVIAGSGLGLAMGFLVDYLLR